MVAYPTEYCYGLGCDPTNREAVRKLLRIKQRATQRGLILIGSVLAQFRPFIWPIKPEIRSRLLASWPGPTTWLVPARPLHKLITGNHRTIALRIPEHPVARELCTLSGTAIVSTSANRRGRRPALGYRDLSRMHLPGLDYVVSGTVGNARRPSAIIDAKTGEFIRQ